ncbi:hypothetical protein [Spirosoma sp.]|uniref:hypothetical protein n=1 Tax=Spirosoma sp. TaxID=1899569 RepID=UPI002613535D|nr:hypothetical protein [Spirosoma sp.]MCX6213273.1 hypothetical protein [Spirosoma sp.]
MNVFTKDAGRILDPQETQALTGAYQERKLQVGLSKDEYIRSEFFGTNHIQYLLSQPGCVGLRIHHAKRWEDSDGKPTSPDKGQLVPRVLLTGVDAKGKDMPIRVDKAGMKDMPADDGSGRAVGDGRPCPQYCGS